MPSGIVANDTLIAFVSVSATGKVISPSGGWNAGDSNNTGNQTGAWFWKQAAGGDTSPTLSWIGSANGLGRIIRFSGAGTPSAPIGAKVNTFANSSTLISVSGITTTADNSLLCYLLSVPTAQTLREFPPSYTVIANGISTPTDYVGYGIVNVSGLTSTALNIGITSTNWVGFGFEINGSGAADTDNLRATGVNQQVLESYVDTTNVRATGVYEQVLESYVSPVMSVRATGVVLQVLRTVDAVPVAGFESNTNLLAMRNGRIKKLTTTLAQGVDFVQSPPPPPAPPGWVTIQC